MTATASQALTAALDDRSSMASCLNLSHEMRTPVHAVLGHAELLLSGSHGPLSSDMRASLGDIQAAGLALSAQIDRMVRMAEGIAADHTAAATTDELKELIGRAWRQSQPMKADDDQPERKQPPCSDRHEADPRPHLLAILLADAGAARPAIRSIDGPRDGNGMGNHYASILDVSWPAVDRPAGSPHVELIQATIKMMGGEAHLEEGRLTLVWPNADRSGPEPARNDEAIRIL